MENQAFGMLLAKSMLFLVVQKTGFLEPRGEKKRIFWAPCVEVFGGAKKRVFCISGAKNLVVQKNGYTRLNL